MSVCNVLKTSKTKKDFEIVCFTEKIEKIQGGKCPKTSFFDFKKSTICFYDLDFFHAFVAMVYTKCGFVFFIGN